MMKKQGRQITVLGMVQGVGYRPFVAELATKLHLSGSVQNAAGIVIIRAFGEPNVLDLFQRTLKEEFPYGAKVMRVTGKEIPCHIQIKADFLIMDSINEISQSLDPLIPPDLPLCSRCEQELKDPKNRRYRYPFISCTSCGPRYTIIDSLPYDRCNTTMEDFPMCEPCSQEYTLPGGIRRHAQTISCHDCGPELHGVFFDHGKKELEREAAYSQAVKLLLNGGILGIRDIGGFHLACSPFQEDCVAALREIKGREKKPFAIMFPDLDAIREFCDVNQEEEELLTSDARPIVLLKKKHKGEDDLNPGVCNQSSDIGAMLACNPLQVMILSDCGPLIMTSGNRSGEPILTENSQMEEWFSITDSPVPLGILDHERRILSPLDDSVMRIIQGKPQIIRRSRGLVPDPIWLSEDSDLSFDGGQVLAFGGDLKSCFGFGAGDRVYLSQYLGDIQEEEVHKLYRKEQERMKHLFHFQPTRFACDLHPGYLTTGMCEKVCSNPVQIQHHHAHVASVIAEHGLTGQILGVAFDGTGFGCDHSVWGGEFLFCTEPDHTMRRAGHLRTVTLVGGDEGARNTDLILEGFLVRLGVKNPKFKVSHAALKTQTHTIESSSMGRLFDAVSALLSICHYNDYEGEAAIALEQVAAQAKEGYPLTLPVVEEDGMYIGDTDELFRQLLSALKSGTSRERLSLGFIQAVGDYTVSTCEKISQADPVKQIALSGGTFQNRLLLEYITTKLRKKGFLVYRNQLVPPNDGGIALGQAYLMTRKKG